LLEKLRFRYFSACFRKRKKVSEGELAASILALNPPTLAFWTLASKSKVLSKGVISLSGEMRAG
jgi:hypothetical protein